MSHIQVDAPKLVFLAEQYLRLELSICAMHNPVGHVVCCKYCAVPFKFEGSHLTGGTHQDYCPIFVAYSILRTNEDAEICRQVKKQAMRKQAEQPVNPRIAELEKEIQTHLAEDDVTKPVIATAHICVHCKYEFKFGAQFINAYLHAPACQFRKDTEAKDGKPSPDTVADTSKLTEYASHDDKSSY